MCVFKLVVCPHMVFATPLECQESNNKTHSIDDEPFDYAIHYISICTTIITTTGQGRRARAIATYRPQTAMW